MSDNLRTLRELKGLSRKELADLVGISFRTIQDYEQGHKKLSSAKSETLLKMSEVIGCTMEDLISDKDLSLFKPSELRERIEVQEDKSVVNTAFPEDMLMFKLDPADQLPYILMHKDDKVASVIMEPVSGALISISEVYNDKLVPIGAKGPAAMLKAWWQRRAVPIYQGKIKKILEKTGFVTTKAYLLNTLGLSLNDCYWMKPANSTYSWDDVSLFRNDFDDVIGAAQFSGLGASIDFRNFDVHFPSASTKGVNPKMWICKDGKRALLKGFKGHNNQKLFNELVAAELHKKQGRFNYLDYRFFKTDIDGNENLVVSSECFTDENIEFISARELIAGRSASDNDYEAFIKACVKGGLSKEYVMDFLDYQILTDFLISNVDRNYDNFGVLRDSNTLKFIDIAPIFDSGNSMFHDLDMSRGTLLLKDIAVDSFSINEAGLIRLVHNPGIIDLTRVLTDDELYQILGASDRSYEEIKLLITIYNKKKDLLYKLTKGDTNWMK